MSRSTASTALPTTMWAAYLRTPGGPEQIRIGELPVPQLGPTDVLVRMTASAVNRVDLFVRSGAYATFIPFPFVIGRDLVGTVAASGPGVDTVDVGDRVWSNSLGHHGRQGAFAEYCAVSADRLYRLPDGVDPVQAVTVLHTAATAWLGLFRQARLGLGEKILVGGGGGGVGSAAVTMAAAAGARVIATASPDDARWCASCGADQVLDYHDAGLARQIHEAAPGGVDVWWDTSGHHDFGAALSLLRPGGRIVVSAGLDAVAPLPVGELYTTDASVCGFAISNASVDDLAGAAAAVNALLAAGRLRGRIAATYRLADAADAHRRLEAGGLRGRIVVIP